MSTETLKEFNEEVAELKNSLYDSMVRNNRSNNPASLDSLHRYEELMRKIFTYWKTLYDSGVHRAYILRMPNEELQDVFYKKTQWFINNILNQPDFNFRTKAMHLLQKNCEMDAVNLNQ